MTKTDYGTGNSGTKISISVICGNDWCPNFGYVFNKIVAHDTLTMDEVEILLEWWGQGSEGEKDYCGSCGELGIAYAEDDPTGRVEGQRGEGR
jgi:hypothetical protein